MTEKTTKYYVPEGSPWPILGSVGLCAIAVGAANFIQQSTDTVDNTGSMGSAVLSFGIIWMIGVMFFWWRDAARESMGGLHSTQMDISYRQGFMWFIFSEVMFFSAFFGALFYARWLIVPWLGGEGNNAMTHELLWPSFQAMWPLTTMPSGQTTEAMGPWGLPAINTFLLITSSITLTIAHHALLAGERGKLKLWLAATVILGAIFLGLQVEEYIHAYTIMGLTLDSGIYGSTFFMLTGFHGMHVTIGTIFLFIMLVRTLRGHMTEDNHFAFEAAAWYWHFVDVVWLFLFIAVYWL